MSSSVNQRANSPVVGLVGAGVGELGFALALLDWRLLDQSSQRALLPYGLFIDSVSVPLGAQIVGSILLAMLAVALGGLIPLLRLQLAVPARRLVAVIVGVAVAFAGGLGFVNLFASSGGSLRLALLIGIGVAGPVFGLCLYLCRPFSNSMEGRI